MLKIEIPTLDEIEKTSKKKRNQAINLIIVLLTGIYGIHQAEEMFVILGWIAIGLSTLLLCTLHIIPIIYWKLFEIGVKSTKKTRKLHLKGPQYLKDRDFETLENVHVNESDKETDARCSSFNLTDVERLYDAYEELCKYVMYNTPTGCNDCPRRRICMGWEGTLLQESLDKIKKFVKEE